MTKRNAEPSTLKRVFDQDIVPLGINAAGRVEGALMRASARARRKPVTAMLAALACGYLMRGLQRPL